MGPYNNCILLDPRSPQYSFTHVFLKHNLREKNFLMFTLATCSINPSLFQLLCNSLCYCWGRKLRLPSPSSHHHSSLQDWHPYAPIKCICNKACCASSASCAEFIKKHTFLSTSDPVLPGLVLNCWQSNPSYSRPVSHIPAAWWACWLPQWESPGRTWQRTQLPTGISSFWSFSVHNITITTWFTPLKMDHPIMTMQPFMSIYLLK